MCLTQQNIYEEFLYLRMTFLIFFVMKIQYHTKDTFK